ncbi:uncharacterized protein A1O9_03016 [Exophiala aquamarina CBS 119918]|uniref:RTA1 domain protein n=1 Tax=Exophiala aquamarina CBS 119918 TaxID=1182545 RepID=A0A072Q0N6_9EURO|nr:uncharacterized protein A1O9_03016 [Exophiala aquamarina CBS 119918]KEF61450.1 hypothetical protein A1O9_03016 [Exophiala aquamarina CBS 119918]
MRIQCEASDAPDALWVYCPSFAAAILFSILFGSTTLAHTVQAVIYRKRFAFVLIMGGMWECGGYITRTLSVIDQKNTAIYTVQQLLILLAPLWINAYIYMLLGRMIHFFLVDDRVFGLRARKITKCFVWFDVIAFLVQATGGMMATPDASAKTQKLGLDIYTAGVGLQLFFLSIFTSLAVGFQRRLKQQSQSPVANDSGSDYDPESYLQPRSGPHTPSPALARRLLILLYIVMVLVIIRNIYRLVEFATGVDSPIVKHEWFSYVWDAAPMFIAMIVLNIEYPGKVLQGPRADFRQEDRDIKMAKKEKKAEKKRQKQERKHGHHAKYTGLEDQA